MSVVSMKELLEAGVHFGHRTRRWNPKMRPFIFTERSGVHIIDLQQTMLRLNEYAALVRDLVAKGGTILFVGTKRQAQATVRQEAERAQMPYINERWLGGTLTNWVTIKQRIDHLLQLERRMDAGEFNVLSKKERLTIQREIDKLNRRIGGLKTMSRLPNMVFIVDTNIEDLAVTEANKLKIPVMAMVDTNSNPDLVDYVIPSNDDAIRAVKLIVSIIADAAEEGVRIREVDMVDTGQVTQADLEAMEQYLGPSTLAKLQTVEEEEFDEGEMLAEDESSDEESIYEEDEDEGDGDDFDEGDDESAEDEELTPESAD
ncbi:MAG: 30S ribosomal protein S2 [Chloroflexi bacterium]|nr:MAG: 30S ribosomal protein S2 [Chloroflexota bacterium]